MRAPAFWASSAGGFAAPVLSPLAWAYDVGAQIKRGLSTRTRASLPVVCVGNFTAGGAGKTPVAMALSRLLQEDGVFPHFLTRGYGGRLNGPILVDPGRHGARDVGDEPLLLAAVGPTWVSRDRPAGAAQAAAAGAPLIVMDDGLQNPSLEKDLSVAVIDGGFGFGNGHLLPAGPLREPVSRVSRRVQAIVLIGPDRTRALDELGPDHPPVLAAELVPGLEAYELGERAVVGFAGIGRPAKFFETLSAIGCEVVARHGFPDHHRYSPDEIMRIVEEAQAKGATPVTTEKDFVRIPPEARAMVKTLSVRLEWRDPGAMRDLLRPIVARVEPAGAE